PYSLVLGARSSIFLPFSNLRLIIVDEEHDASFKQYDPAPRYQARDAAVMLAHFHGAQVLLGSATPSIESYYNALNGKYSLVKLNERFGNAVLPKIEMANLKTGQREKSMKASLSSVLFTAVESALNKKEQIILFQNRRGFAPHVECDNCGHVPHCRNCDVTLTYHKTINMLRCHYCGFSTPVPAECPECHTPRMLMKGLGTERIEEDLTTLFPDARIGRMDLDTTRSKHSYHSILTDFGEHRIDILVGTQMVTKGLDFDRVSVVGVLDADTMLSFPDFRAFERSFQMLMQVSGRAGRKDVPGRVIIQTRNPHHTVLEFVLLNDYYSMYHSQIAERRQYLYPPFVRLILLSVKHPDATVVKEASESLAGGLAASLGTRVLGPVYPVIGRVKNQYIRLVVLKLERSVDLRPMKQQILVVIQQVLHMPGMSRLQIVPDVDPS
ncbi:MAG: primosomal protein N', partial [Bacteroidetes bacterium HGW-Bacteroidetes-22]